MAPTGEAMGGSLHTKLHGGPKPAQEEAEAGMGAAPSAHPLPPPSGLPLRSPPRRSLRPRPEPRCACSSSTASSTRAEPDHATPDEARGAAGSPGSDRTLAGPRGPGVRAAAVGAPPGLESPRTPGGARGRQRRALRLGDLGQLRASRGRPSEEPAPRPGARPSLRSASRCSEPRRSCHCPGTARGCDLGVATSRPGTRAPPGAPRSSPGTSAAGS